MAGFGRLREPPDREPLASAIANPAVRSDYDGRYFHDLTVVAPLKLRPALNARRIPCR